MAALGSAAAKSLTTDPTDCSSLWHGTRTAIRPGSERCSSRSSMRSARHRSTCVQDEVLPEETTGDPIERAAHGEPETVVEGNGASADVAVLASDHLVRERREEAERINVFGALHL